MPLPGLTGSEKTFARESLRAGVLEIRMGTATALAGAATANTDGAGIITSEVVSNAAATVYSLTVTNNMIAAADMVLASVWNGSNTGGQPNVASVTPGAGSVVIAIQNIHASTAFNGTLKVGFLVIKPQG